MTDARAARAGVPARLLIALSLLGALGPLSVDAYLPGFPDMATDLGTTASSVHLTLTAFLLGLAGGPLVIGPLSDRFGRRSPLLISMVVCTLASIGAAWTDNVSVMIACRFVQGFTGAAGMVIGRSIVTDLSSGRSAIRAFSVLAAIGSFAPVVAPLLGGLLMPSIGWRGILWVVALGAALMTILSAVLIRETLAPHHRTAGGIAETGRTVVRLSRNRVYVGYLLVAAIGFGAILAYVSASPFVLQNVFGLSAGAFSLAFALNSTGLILASFVNARLVSRIEPARILEVAQVGLVVVAGLLAITVLTGVATIVTVLPMTFVMVTLIAFVLSNASALAMVSIPSGSGNGTAAALLGSVQFGVGAVASPLVGLGGENSATAMVVVIAGCAVIGLGLVAIVRRSPVRIEDYATDIASAPAVPTH